MLDSTLNTVEHLAKQLSDLQTENSKLASMAGSVDRFVCLLLFLSLLVNERLI